MWHSVAPLAGCYVARAGCVFPAHFCDFQSSGCHKAVYVVHLLYIEFAIEDDEELYEAALAASHRPGGDPLAGLLRDM